MHSHKWNYDTVSVNILGFLVLNFYESLLLDLDVKQDENTIEITTIKKRKINKIIRVYYACMC